MNLTRHPFTTLLLREWMQHKRGWMVLLGIPFAILLLALIFGGVHLGAKGERLPPSALALMMGAATLASTLALTWLAVLLQAPGLARRDTQDRSIEFWLSLPTPPAQSLAATLTAHLVLVPWMAMVVGIGGAALLGPLMVLKAVGPAGIAAVPWGELLVIGAAMGLRLTLGIVLATIWLSPLILGLMAASAWLKRWGVAGAIGVLSVGGGLERLFFGTRSIVSTVRYLTENAGGSLLGASVARHKPEIHIDSPADFDQLLPYAPQWLMQDLGAALSWLLEPGLVAVLAASAGFFALLVMRRQRGG